MIVKPAKKTRMSTRSCITTVVVIVCWFSAVIPSHADPLDHWHVRNPPSSPTGYLAAVTYGSGLFVAVGYETDLFAPARDWILTSPDGAVWTSHTPGTTNQLAALAHGNGIFVAVGGRSPNGDLTAATIATSSDGAAWVNSASFPSNTFRAVTYGNGVFVAVGWRLIATSSNGMNWTVQSLPGINRLIGVAFGNGFFAAATDDGDTLTSLDGSTWVNRGRSQTKFAITFGNGLFVTTYGEAGAGFGTWFFASADGETWTSRGFLGGQYFGDQGLAYGNGRFVVLGSSHPRIAWLDTNATPVKAVEVGDFGLQGVTYGRGTFVAVGLGGAILQSDPLPTARLSGSPPGAQGFPLTITGEAGLSYRLQASAELPSTNWTDLLAFTNAAPATNFVDTDAANFNRRFYRVVSP